LVGTTGSTACAGSCSCRGDSGGGGAGSTGSVRGRRRCSDSALDGAGVHRARGCGHHNGRVWTAAPVPLPRAAGAWDHQRHTRGIAHAAFRGRRRHPVAAALAAASAFATFTLAGCRAGWHRRRQQPGLVMTRVRLRRLVVQVQGQGPGRAFLHARRSRLRQHHPPFCYHAATGVAQQVSQGRRRWKRSHGNASCVSRNRRERWLALRRHRAAPASFGFYTRTHRHQQREVVW
jgi:hypothetical protein